MKRHEPFVVPAKIRYISDWKDYNLSWTPGKCIIDKKVPGCGFTEFYLTNSENVILCSPRIMLLQNKYDQHLKKNKGEELVHFAKNELDKDLCVDKDISRDPKENNSTSIDYNNLLNNSRNQAKKELFVELGEEDDIRNKSIYNSMREKLIVYIDNMNFKNLPKKILVTYDSYRIVKAILEDLGIFTTFITMVDEFQTVIADATFKADTEQKFMKVLDKVEKVHFVSATPMLDEYLDQIPEFKDLDYYSIDWCTGESGRLIKPNLELKFMKSVNVALAPIIKSYKSGKFEKLYVKNCSGNTKEIISDEAVFYVNSVNHIISAIGKLQLQPEEVNILCAKTPENVKRINDVLNKPSDVKSRGGSKFEVGEIPLAGVKPKMFTFCTRTVYLGADFYSECARTFIFSDSNSKCLAVDISQDLPQILGRQRLKSNPWKNSAVFFYRPTADYNKMSKEDFDAIVNEKISVTENLLQILESIEGDSKREIFINTLSDNKDAWGYKKNYISINGHGENRTVTTNCYVLVAEKRAFDIQQVDYKDRFSVFSEIVEQFGNTEDHKTKQILEEYLSLTQISERTKYVCDLWFKNKNHELMLSFLNQLPDTDYAKSYYLSLGPEKCRALCYNITNIRKELNKKFSNSLEDLAEEVYSTYNIGDKISKNSLKQFFADLYEKFNYEATPKSTDIDKYFETKVIKINENGKRVNGFEIIKKK